MGISITSPSVGGAASVQRMGDPGPASPLICHVAGAFAYTSDYQLAEILVLATKSDTGANPAGGASASGGEPFASTQDEINAVIAAGVSVPSANIDTSSDTWFIDTSVVANIDRDPDVTWNHISAYAVVNTLNANAPDLTASDLLAHQQFKASPVAVGACPREAPPKKKHESEKAAKSRMTAVLPPIMLKPLEVTDGWIRYSFFSQSGGSFPRPSIFGYQLATPNCCETPLQARSIAIAAGDIEWRPRWNRNLVITRPYGILDTSAVDSPLVGQSSLRSMRFPGLSKFSLVVHQSRSRPDGYLTQIPVDSDSRDRPLRILLDPMRPFYVQVNNILEDLTKGDGTLDFWIKVLC